MKSFQADHEYAVPPGQLFDLLTDPAFLAAKQARFGGAGEAAVAHAGDRVTLRVPRQIPLDSVPPVARGLLPNGGRITHVETWTAGGEPLSAVWQAEVGPAPAEVGGTAYITSTGTGCRYAVAGEAEVRVPLLGARLEEMIVEYLSRLLAAEQAYAEEWLAGAR